MNATEMHAKERQKLQLERDILKQKITEVQKQIPTELPAVLIQKLARHNNGIALLSQVSKRSFFNRILGKEPRTLLAAEIKALEITLEKNQIIQVYFLEKELLQLNKQFLEYYKKIKNFHTLPEMIKEDLIRIQGIRLVAMQHLHVSQTLNELLPHLPALLLSRTIMKNGINYLKSAATLEQINVAFIEKVPRQKSFNLFSFLWEKIAYICAYTLFLIRYLWTPATHTISTTAPVQRPLAPLDTSQGSTYASYPSPRKSLQPLNSPNA